MGKTFAERYLEKFDISRPWHVMHIPKANEMLYEICYRRTKAWYDGHQKFMICSMSVLWIVFVYQMHKKHYLWRLINVPEAQKNIFWAQNIFW